MAEFFDDIHSTYKSELGGEPLFIEDSPAVSKAKMELKDSSSYIALGKAYAKQLRYHEAISAYTKALELSPDSYEAHRLRGGRYLTTLSTEEANQDLKWCLLNIELSAADGKEVDKKKTDVLYLLGLSSFYSEDYEKAVDYFERAIEYSDDEMGIAIIYRHTIASSRISRPLSLLEKRYNTSMKIGHHTAYDSVMRVWCGLSSPDKLLQQIEKDKNDLEYSMVVYGLSNYYRWKGEEKISRKLLLKVLSRDSFWISFAFIGAWNDENRRVL